MKPVVVFRHALTEGAGYLGTFLTQKAIPWHMVRIDQGEPVPVNALDYSGIVLMGGPMSVNDDLPWIPPLLSLIRHAASEDVPLLGHCLGGQLISKALGASVGSNPVKEIGWGETHISENEESRKWFGDLQRMQVFHWHGETFELPSGATHLLSSAHCRNQAYSIGKHLAFQCHIEMTAEMVKTWCEVGQDEIAAAIDSPGVQSAEEIHEDLTERIARLNAIAHPLYERWIAGLKAN